MPERNVDGDVTKSFTDKGGSGRVGIFNLSPGLVRYEFAATLLEMVMYEHNRAAKANAFKDDGTIQSAIGDVGFQTSGAVLSIYRNVMVEEFLDGPHDWMLFLDSDMQLPHNTVELLLEVADPDLRPIVGGLYMMSQPDGNVPNMLYWGLDKGTGKYRMHPRPGFIPEDELIEVDGTGAGCLLMHRSLLIKMYEHYGSPEPWFALDHRDGTQIGEDYSFTMRAKDLGVPTYVRTGIRIGHAGKTMTVTPGMHNGPTLRGYDGRVHSEPPKPEA